MAAKKSEVVEEQVKAEKPAKEDDDRVMVMVPYVEGQDPEVTVTINYETTKFRKGETVMVSKAVAEVLKNSNQQMMSALRNQEKFKSQRTDL